MPDSDDDDDARYGGNFGDGALGDTSTVHLVFRKMYELFRCPRCEQLNHLLFVCLISEWCTLFKSGNREPDFCLGIGGNRIGLSRSSSGHVQVLYGKERISAKMYDTRSVTSTDRIFGGVENTHLPVTGVWYIQNNTSKKW